MFVKDLFLACDINKVTDIVAKKIQKEEENFLNNKLVSRDSFVSKVSSKILDSFKLMLEIEPNYSDENILCCLKTSYPNNEEFDDVFMVKKSDVISSNENEYAETYAVEFESWEDILGYIVSETSLKNYDIDNLAANFYSEMTFFGLMQDERDSAILDAKNEIKKSLAEIEGEMAEYISIEDMPKVLFPASYEDEENIYECDSQEISTETEELVKKNAKRFEDFMNDEKDDLKSIE
jgi:hypothetical protein